MISLFLLTFVYGSNALALANLIQDGPLLYPIKNNTLKSQTMFEKIKADPKEFVSEVQKLDPAALQNVVSLLEELLASSEAREGHLADSLEDANNALDTANTDVLNALDDLTAAQTRTAAAITAVTNANQEQSEAEAAEAAVQTDLEQKRQVHNEKQTEQGVAQTAHDDEIPSLNNEQQVLRDVIAMLQGLPEAPKGGRWIKGPNGEDCVKVCQDNSLTCNAEPLNELTTESALLAAFKESGYECITYGGTRDYDGTPFSTGRSGDDCYAVTPGATVDCVGNAAGHHAPLCYCE